jgi:hypothetical protein
LREAEKFGKHIIMRGSGGDGMNRDHEFHSGSFSNGALDFALAADLLQPVTHVGQSVSAGG